MVSWTFTIFIGYEGGFAIEKKAKELFNKQRDNKCHREAVEVMLMVLLLHKMLMSSLLGSLIMRRLTITECS